MPNYVELIPLSAPPVQITCVHASEKGLREGHPSHSGHSAQNDGGVVVTGSDDKTVRVWNAASGNVLKVVGEHGGPVSCVLLQPGRIISACFDGKVRFIDILTGSCIRTVAGHRNAVMSIDAKGSIVISGGNDRDLRVSFYSPSSSLVFSSSERQSPPYLRGRRTSSDEYVHHSLMEEGPDSQSSPRTRKIMRRTLS